MKRHLPAPVHLQLVEKVFVSFCKYFTYTLWLNENGIHFLTVCQTSGTAKINGSFLQNYPRNLLRHRFFSNREEIM